MSIGRRIAGIAGSGSRTGNRFRLRGLLGVPWGAVRGSGVPGGAAGAGPSRRARTGGFAGGAGCRGWPASRRYVSQGPGAAGSSRRSACRRLLRAWYPPGIEPSGGASSARIPVPCLAPAATAAIPPGLTRPLRRESGSDRSVGRCAGGSRMCLSAGVSRGLRGPGAEPETVSGFAGVLASRRAACRRLRGRGNGPVASRAAATARLPARRSGPRRRGRRSRGRCTGLPSSPTASLQPA